MVRLTLVLDKIRGNLADIPTAIALLAALIRLLKPSRRRVIFVDNPYGYLLLLCSDAHNLDDAFFVLEEYLVEPHRSGKVKFPNEILYFLAPQRIMMRRLTNSLMTFVLNLKSKLFPMHLTFAMPPPGKKFRFRVQSPLIDFFEDGAGSYKPMHNPYVYDLWLRNKIHGYLHSGIYPNIWDIPEWKVCLPAEIPRRLELLTEAFPDLKEATKFIEPYKKLSKLAVVFTQPLCPDMIVRTAEVQRNVYEDIVALLIKHGYRILLREHPRDKEIYPSIASLHGVEVWQRGYFPGEVIAAILKDSLILSVSSTVTMAMGDRDRKSITLGSKWLYKCYKAGKIFPVDIPHRVTGGVKRELVAELMEAR